MNKLSVKITSRLRVNILFFPLLAASILGRYAAAFLLSYLCAVLHELAHIAAARKLNVGISYIEIQPFGVCCCLKSEIIQNPSAEIVIALVGPLSNFAAAAVVYLLPFTNEYTLYFTECNIAIAAINLVPALPLDGGRVLRASLTLAIGSLRAYNITVKFSRLPIVLILSAAVYGLLTHSFNFSLILIGAFLTSNLCNEQKNISHRTLREILDYKTKLTPDSMHRSVVLTAHSSTPARRILKRLSYNNYHIVHVTDDNMRIIRTLTEGQLLNALTENGIRVLLSDIK